MSNSTLRWLVDIGMKPISGTVFTCIYIDLLRLGFEALKRIGRTALPETSKAWRQLFTAKSLELRLGRYASTKLFISPFTAKTAGRGHVEARSVAAEELRCTLERHSDHGGDAERQVLASDLIF